MCGIVGYNGNNKASEILLDGLSKLEYRGYDSAGIAVLEDNEIKVFKAKGKISALREKIENEELNGTVGIGHTRWATHGEPSETNAHPHVTFKGQVTLVHNGIIENYQEIIEKLKRHDYTFYSQTDTEILGNLIEYYYYKYNMGPIDAINRTMVRVRGSYAIAVMFKDFPGELYVARKDSPMIIGVSKDATYVASDAAAILKYTRNVYYIDNLEAARLTNNEVTFYDLNGDVIEKELKEIKWDLSAAEKEGYEHFMIKEIHEQSDVISKTINSFVQEGKIDFSNAGVSDEVLSKVKEIYIVACGSAYHAGVTSSYVIEDLARIPVKTDIASEFRYRKPILNKDGLVIIISQSGETADSLAALREAKNAGVKTLAIVNVVGSSIAREADYCLYTLAGPEISVATTKAYSTQLIVGYLLAIKMAYLNNQIDDKKYEELINDLLLIPSKVKETTENTINEIQKIASKHSSIKDAFFIGRSLDYATCLEGSLKLKEVSYIHSEAYAAGELKHGTISLIEDNTLVIGVVTQEEIAEKTISNLVEVKSRGAYVATVCTPNIDTSKVAEEVITISETNKYFYPSLSVIPLQLLGYYVSVSRGLDVDKPRNLAKSVTVE